MNKRTFHTFILPALLCTTSCDITTDRRRINITGAMACPVLNGIRLFLAPDLRGGIVTHKPNTHAKPTNNRL